MGGLDEQRADLQAYTDLVWLCLNGAVWTGDQWVVEFQGRVYRAGDAHPPWQMANAIVDRYPRTFVGARKHRDRLREVSGVSGDGEEELGETG